MKKVTKCVVLAIAAVLIVLLGAGLLYYLPMFKMNSVETGHITDTHIYAVKDIGVNVFFVKTNNGYIMVDAGLNIKNMENALKEAKIKINDVRWILLTHSDGDHVAALALFPDASVYMSRNELPLINGTMKRNFLGSNKMPAGVNTGTIILLSDGQELSLHDTKVKCILAPGHTIGSMMYLIDDRYLFTGDVFMIKDGNMEVHPYSMDALQSKKTIEELSEKFNGDTVMLTSHYGLHYLKQ